MKRYILFAGLSDSMVGWACFVTAGDTVEEVKRSLTLTDKDGDRPYPNHLFYCHRKGEDEPDLVDWYEVIDMEECDMIEDGGVERL